MRNKLLLLFAIISLLTLTACGPETSSGDSVASDDMDNLRYNALVFNPTDSIIPFPNDIKWSAPGTDHDGKVYFEITSDMTPAEQALYTGLNNLSVKGFSPAAPIGIPLANDIKITNLEDKISLIDIDDLTTEVIYICGGTDNETCLSEEYMANYQDINETFKLDIKQDGKTIKLYPVMPLDPGHQYLVVIDGGLKDVNNNLVQAPILYEDGLKSTDNLTGSLADLEPLRQAYLQLWDVLKFVGTDKENVLEIFTFTTADKFLSMADLGAISQGRPDLVTGRSYDNITEELNDPASGILAGAYGMFNTPLVSVDNDNKTFNSFDFTTLTDTVPTAIKVPFTVIPALDNSTDNVIVYQHGYTVDKSTVAALRYAQGVAALSGVNFAIIAADLPLHGDRVDYDNSSYDCNGDGQVTSGECFITDNIPQTRVNFIQAVFDQKMLLNYLSTANIDLNEDGIPDHPSNIYFVGMSMGSITGSMAVGNEMAETFNSIFGATIFQDMTKSVLNVGGAGMANLFDTSKDMEAFVAQVLAAKGIEKDSAEYFGFLGILQWLIDDADPIYQATGTDISDKLILQAAYNDSFVTNLTNDTLALAMNVSDDATEITEDTYITSAASGYYWFKMTTGEDTPHAFLLYIDRTNEETFNPLSEQAQKQIAIFFSTPLR